VEVGCFYIKGSDCFAVITSQIEREFKSLYKKSLADGTLYFLEDYSLLANSDLMIVISILKQNNSRDFCEVEIVAGGGGTGIFSVKFGSEDRRVNDVYKKMSKICGSANFEISKIVVSD
jgi:hypothetical protein